MYKAKYIVPYVHERLLFVQYLETPALSCNLQASGILLTPHSYKEILIFKRMHHSRA